MSTTATATFYVETSIPAGVTMAQYRRANAKPLGRIARLVRKLGMGR